MGKRMEITDNKKSCAKCKQMLQVDNFRNRNDSNNGLRSYCKNCESIIRSIDRKDPNKLEKKRESARKHHYKDLDKSRKRARDNSRKITNNNLSVNMEYRLRKEYNITPEYYNEMLEKQNYKCKGCSNLFSNKCRPEVDHNHTTGKVRGLLCGSCNRGLGLLKEKRETLNNLVLYLEEYGE